MKRVLVMLYGVISYVVFLASFVYAILFVENIWATPSLDGPSRMPWMQAALIDAGLLALFAVQHSVMARRGFKRVWTKLVPPAIERSTFVLFSSAALYALCRWWEPLPALYGTKNGMLSAILLAVSLFGFGVVLISTFLVNHFELFGLKQVSDYWRGIPPQPLAFKTPALYKVVRHPIYLGFVIAFWAAPRMSMGHMFFAVMCTAYILVAVQFEERDLISLYGDTYREYRKQVSMIIPFMGGGVPEKSKAAVTGK
jgi:methanethiol S-methyltransferase